MKRLAHFTYGTPAVLRVIKFVSCTHAASTPSACRKVKRLRDNCSPRFKQLSVIPSLLKCHSCFIPASIHCFIFGAIKGFKFHVPCLDYLGVGLLVCVLRATNLGHVLLVIELTTSAHFSLHPCQLVLQLLYQILLLEHSSKVSISFACGYNLVKVSLFRTSLTVQLFTGCIDRNSNLRCTGLLVLAIKWL